MKKYALHIMRPEFASRIDNDIKIPRHDVNAKLFQHFFVSLQQFSFWSKFHVNTITGCRVS